MSCYHSWTLSKVSPNSHCWERYLNLLLHKNAFWIEKCMDGLSGTDEEGFQRTYWGNHGNLRWWYHCIIQEERINSWRFEERFFKNKGDRDEIKSQEVYFWSTIRKMIGVFGVWKGHWSQSPKIKAIQGILEPRNIKEVLCLPRRMASLGQFLSRAGEKVLLVYRILKKPFQFWTDKRSQLRFSAAKNLPFFFSFTCNSPRKWGVLFIHGCHSQSSKLCILCFMR